MKKIWFITGSSSGIGRALTEAVLARGDIAAATARSPATLSDLKEQYGAQLWTAPLDVTDKHQVREVVKQSYEALGRLDVIVNNAGYGLMGELEGYSDEQVEGQIATNLMGSIEVVRATLPLLRQQGSGHIVQISSSAGQATFPGATLYCAAKFGIEGFMECVAKEVAHLGIQCTVVEPGGVATDFFTRSPSLGKAVNAYAEVAHPVRAMYGSTEKRNSDPVKVAQVLIELADNEKPPLRVALGSDGYQMVLNALTERLQDFEKRQDIAPRTDAD